MQIVFGNIRMADHDCQSMDGTGYESPDDAPIPLHPNCKCRIEEISDDEPNDDDEPCDCVERLDALIQELEENYSDLESIDGEAQADSERDQVANRLGRERGRSNPTCDCRILMQDLKPTKKK